MGCSSSLAKPLWAAHGGQGAFSDVSIIRLLGEGSHSRVYKGSCKNGGGMCAVKFAHPKKICVDLLKAEAAILEQLDHPNIAKVYRCSEGPLGSYMAMELCSGGDVFDLVGGGPLPENVAVQVMRQLFAAVAYMHSRGICHCDLKEENLLLCSPLPGKNLQIKVCDFGIARHPRCAPSPWAAGMCTPSHAAPEVLNGEAGSQASDLWSCGVILYAILCGCRPFEGVSRDQVLANIRSAGPSFTEAAWATVSEKAVDLIRHLLRTERGERHTANQALANACLAGHEHVSANAKVSEPSSAKFLVDQAVAPWNVAPRSLKHCRSTRAARTAPLPHCYQQSTSSFAPFAIAI